MSIALSALAGCGSGGGGVGGGGLPNPPSGNSAYTQGVFSPSSTYANQCASPRANSSDRTGSAFTENMFLRSWTNELYLWYREVPDRDPTGFTVASYFEDVLLTPATTGSGRPKDQFHFTYPTDVWEDLSQSGVEIGYGAQFILLSRSPPRRLVIAYVEPGTPAASAGLSRGAEVLIADGIDVVNANTATAVDILNAALFPGIQGRAHTFSIRELDATVRDVTMTPVEIKHEPVPLATIIDPTGDRVGYLLFHDHIATAELALMNAVNQLRAANIQDLVLDLRYNGGGYLDIASELAYMIGGSRTTGQFFERLVFNDKYPSTNPITGQPLRPTPFHTTTQGFNVSRGTPLPTLDLNRVYVITGNNTCSASESIINGLRGIGVQVYQIGATTCGKPYGFYPQNNCGTTYFSIQFQGQNAAGFGDYSDGFTPQNSTNTSTARLSGCAVADDFTMALGDANEARLSAAMAYRRSGNQTCPAVSAVGPNAQLKGTRVETPDGFMVKSPMLQNRILRDGSYEPPSSATRVRMLHTPEPRD